MYMYVCMYGMVWYGMEWNGMEWKVMYVCIRRHAQTQRSMVCAGCFLFWIMSCRFYPFAWLKFLAFSLEQLRTVGMLCLTCSATESVELLFLERKLATGRTGLDFLIQNSDNTLDLALAVWLLYEFIGHPWWCFPFTCHVENLTFWHKLVSHSLVVLAVQHGASGGTGESEIIRI